MSDVQFESDNQFKITSPSVGIMRAENKMAEWLMHKGIAKSESQAQLMMLGIAAGAVVIAVVVWLMIYPSDRSGQVYKGPLESTEQPTSVRTNAF